MRHIFELAARNTEEAWAVIRDLGIERAWQSIGAQVNLVGSLKTGLLCAHRDIDFHVYTPELIVPDSFSAIAQLAANPAVKRVEYGNLIDTEEKCLEWHLWYQAPGGHLWQIDMIHILQGSAYDGFAEKAAARIAAVLTPETREAILRIKYETPEDEKVMGIEYYVAVLRDGVRTYPEFTQWRKNNRIDYVELWAP